MKPVLIDALYINSGGGLSILQRLIGGLKDSKVDYILIKDQRCKRLEGEDYAKEVIVIPPSMIKRHCFYLAHKNDFCSILCFGNIPPSIKMSSPVHTYFHNLSILIPPKTYSKKRRVLFSFKRFIIKVLSRNTDTWIVQTSFTASILEEKIGNNKKKPFFIYPIYTLPDRISGVEREWRSDYLFIGDYTYSKGHDVLLRAWEKLYNMGRHLVLNLTVNRRPATEPFCQKLDSAIKNGVPIINHGFVPFDRVCDLYARSKAIVYPSQLESLGLGIVEGITAGCDVIVSDLPYAHAICKPSETFNPNDDQSIVDAVLRYELGNSPKSILTIKDCLDELIELLIA